MSERTLPTLSKQQAQILEVLNSKSANLRDIFLSYIYSLHQIDNPGRFSLAAHELRELQKKLPSEFGVKAKSRSTSLGDRFNPLKNLWKHVQHKSKSKFNGRWSGKIDKPLAKFLSTFDEVAQWHDEQSKGFRNEMTTFYRGTDPRQIPNSPTVEDFKFQQWDLLNRYFNNIAHHGELRSPSEFEENAIRLERLLLDALQPETFANYDEIDSLLRKYQ